ncbi:MAG: coproporphyrinogen dehydrogenase HemZ, partial [Oscillospiraceae bacterium]|nr:coproporphyrinogen dehydrogenase HemZ [Oscillospiraceae bacterium]
MYISATTMLIVGGRSARGLARVRASEITDKTSRDRLLQKIIKSSFYKAAAIITGTEPEWG